MKYKHFSEDLVSNILGILVILRMMIIKKLKLECIYNTQNCV